MNNISIHVFINAFWRYNNSLSGSDVRAINIFSRIKSKFSSIVVFTDYSGMNYIKDKGITNNIKYSTLFFNKLDIPISYILRTIYAVFQMFFLKEPNIYYSTSDFPPDVIPVFLFKRKAKWVQLIHHFYEEPRIRKGNIIVNYMGYYAQQFSHFLIKLRADAVIVVNSSVKQILVSKGFDSKKIHIIPNGVDTSFFNKLTAFKDTNKKDSSYDGVYIGRLNPTKGLMDLLNIWNTVLTKIPHVKLAIIGSGEEEYIKELESYIKTKGLENKIYLLGSLDNEKAFSILKSSKLFLSPSYEEGWGMTIAEASACSVPSIVWDLPVFDEVFEDTIIKIEKGNTKEFAKQIITLLKDNAFRISFGKKAHKFIQKYDWNNIVAKEIDIILDNHE